MAVAAYMNTQQNAQANSQANRRYKIGIISSLFSLVLVGLADHFTSPEIAFSLFYLIPVYLSAWNSGRRAGLIIAFASAALWFAIDSIANVAKFNLWINIWNAVTRLGFFIVVAILLDLLRVNMDKLQRLAGEDGLTTLMNRRFFYETLERELQRCRRFGHSFGLVYIDLDNFKHVNDHYGHSVGDQLLVKVAEVLSTRLRKSDVVARLGGDEFACLMTELNEKGTLELVRQIEKTLNQAMQEAHWPVTFSFGVITCSEKNTNVAIESLLPMADALMYQVKREGKAGIRHQALG